MSQEKIWIIAVIAVCAICTLLERALPFLIFRGRDVPETVTYLGTVLPMAIMTTLVFYCLRNVEFHSASLWAPQLVSCALTAGLHLWKRNTLLSIAGGTLCCMIMTQYIF